MIRLRLLLLALLLAGTPVGVDAKEDAPEMRLRLLPPQVAATLRGPAALSSDAHADLTKWLSAQKLVATDVAYAVFHTHKGEIDTQVYMPVLWDGGSLPKAKPGEPCLTRMPTGLYLTMEIVGTAGPQRDQLAEAARKRGLQPDPEHWYLRELTPGAMPPRVEVGVAVSVRGKADVGIYVGPGAHPNAIRTASAAVVAARLVPTPLIASDINGGGFAKRVRTVLFPGGWAADYRRDIAKSGIRHIESFVDKGGGYIGVCAGAFFAFPEVRWVGEKIAYPLKLIDGVAEGPIDGIAPWPTHALAPLRIDTKHPLAKDLDEQRFAFYLGGPVLQPTEKAMRAVQVLARYREGGGPAILTSRRKKGRVFLTGVHIEYDLTSGRDDLLWPESEGKLVDRESDWDIFQRGVRWAVGKTK